MASKKLHPIQDAMTTTAEDTPCLASEPDLQHMWREAITAKHLAEARAAAFNVALAEERARRLVPPGFEIDYLGDGAIKPVEQCLRRPK